MFTFFAFVTGTQAEKWYEGIEQWHKGQYFFSSLNVH
jgi:hypothetical protein